MSDVTAIIRRISSSCDVLFLRERGQEVLPTVASETVAGSLLLDAAALVDHYKSVVPS